MSLLHIIMWFACIARRDESNFRNNCHLHLSVFVYQFNCAGVISDYNDPKEASLETAKAALLN